MVIRDKIFSTITQVFKRHGAVTIDTPVFELKEILSGKYGEDSKLIYDLQDQGGEICSLRYDLTVPFARWLAMNSSIQSIKRYHIAKVYRRDQPAMSKGRMREFYQCDFDIAGQYDPMLPDAEIIRIICEVFNGLGWDGNYVVKINHRGILDGIFALCGVPEEKIRSISSAVDKLDKLPWEEVKREMVEEKGLNPEIADKIWTFVQRKGAQDVLNFLKSDESLKSNASMVKGIEDMDLLFSYLEPFGVLDQVSFDLSLARGLDYYTGVIFEVVTEGSAPSTKSARPSKESHKPSTSTEVRYEDQAATTSEASISAPTSTRTDSTPRPPKKHSKPKDPDEDRSNDPTLGVGSIAAGGRYDNLVGMFSGKAQIPCVGISFGVDRIFSIQKARMEAERRTQEVRLTEVDVYVMAFGGGKTFTGFLKERMEVCRVLWDAGIKAEFSYKLKPKLPAQFKSAEASGVPFAVILAEEEQKMEKVKIKELGLPEGHPEKEGVLVDLKDLVPEVKARLQAKEEGSLAGGVKELSLEDGQREKAKAENAV